MSPVLQYCAIKLLQKKKMQRADSTEVKLRVSKMNDFVFIDTSTFPLRLRKKDVFVMTDIYVVSCNGSAGYQSTLQGQQKHECAAYL